MSVRKLFASFIAASLIAVPAERAQANDGAALLGGLLLGGIIVNEVNKNNQRKRYQQQQAARQRSQSSSASSAQRQENRQVQSALNYFGYNVGTVDGALGRKSRAGISRYQADMGYQPDGRLDAHEKDFLLGSHQRALASGSVPPYNQVLASQGPNGLLRTYRNEQLGVPTQSQPNVQQATAPAPKPAPVQTQPETVPARANNAELPGFTFGQVDRSVNEHCNEVNVLTAANGGITTKGQVTDANFALNEQFCLARTHAMAESTRIEATIPNLNSDQIIAQCDGLTQVIAPHMADLSSAGPDQVISDTRAVLDASGQPMEQLISGGKVCLGVGYRTDNAQMALASAVLLTAAGESGYGEIISHQMREGFGTAKAQPGAAGAWMKQALDSAASGSPMVLGQSPDRIAVLSEASGAAYGSASLPSFSANSGN